MMKKEASPSTGTNAFRPARSKRGRWRKTLLFAFCGLILAAIVAGLWPRPIPVETGEVTRRPLTVSVLEEGKTRIRHRYVISPPVAGFLNRVALRAGAPIRAGETVLAIIEPELSGFLDPRARAEAEARHNAAEATAMQRRSEVARAKAELDLAQKDYARAKKLYENKVLARQAWDAAENRVRVLTREVNAAEFALRVADFETAQAKAALAQPESPVPGKSQPLKIVAPVDGYVLNVYEENARVVAAGTPIMEVGDPHDMEAEIELLSSEAVSVAPGADVSIEQWGEKRRCADG